jgi:hypothetical protein
VLNWILATLLRSGLAFRRVVAATYGAMAVASWILLGLLPIAALFTYTAAPSGGTPAEQQMTHHCLLLTQVAVIAAAGLSGNAALRGGLGRIVSPGCSTAHLHWSWVGAFALVGCQLSWIPRPFFGSPFLPTEFLRADALERNFFEVVLLKMIPYVLTGGR